MHNDLQSIPAFVIQAYHRPLYWGHGGPHEKRINCCQQILAGEKKSTKAGLPLHAHLARRAAGEVAVRSAPREHVHLLLHHREAGAEGPEPAYRESRSSGHEAEELSTAFRVEVGHHSRQPLDLRMRDTSKVDGGGGGVGVEVIHHSHQPRDLRMGDRRREGGCTIVGGEPDIARANHLTWACGIEDGC